MFSNMLNSWKTSLLGMGAAGTVLATDTASATDNRGLILSLAKAGFFLLLGLFSKDHNK